MHLTADELERWRDSGAASDRDRVVGHLAACGVCSARYAEMIRTRPSGVFAGAAPAYAERGAAVLAAGGRRGGAGADWRWALAAAAMVVCAAGAGLWLRPSVNEPSVMRGDAAEVTLVRPEGDGISLDDLVFEWRSADGEGPFHLRVVDLAAPESPVIDRPDAASGYRPSADERSRLEPGVRYRWFLEYREASGATRSSPAGTFSIR